MSVKDIQRKFFLKVLPSRKDGRYPHYKYGLIAPPDSVVLFQYSNVLVAYAIFRGRERFGEPDKEGYEGALYFDVKSIRRFNPVGSDVVSRIWPEFKRFSQVKQSLDPKSYAKFERELKYL